MPLIDESSLRNSFSQQLKAQQQLRLIAAGHVCAAVAAALKNCVAGDEQSVILIVKADGAGRVPRSVNHFPAEKILAVFQRALRGRLIRDFTQKILHPEKREDCPPHRAWRICQLRKFRLMDCNLGIRERIFYRRNSHDVVKVGVRQQNRQAIKILCAKIIHNFALISAQGAGRWVNDKAFFIIKRNNHCVHIQNASSDYVRPAHILHAERLFVGSGFLCGGVCCGILGGHLSFRDFRLREI